MRRATVAVVVAFVVAALAGSVAGAHSEQGLMKVRADPGDGDGTVVVRAELVYGNDLDAASSATVTVEAFGPNGAAIPATPLDAEGDGVYRTTLSLPVAGLWTVRATATGPAAVAEATFDHVLRTRASPTAIDEPAPVSDQASGRTQDGPSQESGSEPWPVVLVIAAVIVLLVGAGVGVLRMRSHRA